MTDFILDGKQVHKDLLPAVLLGPSNAGAGYNEVKVASDGGLIINQNTTVDLASSSIANIAAGATYSGPWVADLNYTAVQYTIKADQNLLIYVDQSPDGTNPDIVDTFDAYTSEWVPVTLSSW